VREADGLALSSRNVYLSREQRSAAPSIYRALKEIAAAIAAGERDPERVRAAGLRLLEAPLVWDYLDVVDPKTFVSLSPVVRPALVVAVARAGQTRLLDNVPVPAEDGVDPILTPLQQRVRAPR